MMTSSNARQCRVNFQSGGTSRTILRVRAVALSFLLWSVIDSLPTRISVLFMYERWMITFESAILLGDRVSVCYLEPITLVNRDGIIQVGNSDVVHVMIGANDRKKRVGVLFQKSEDQSHDLGREDWLSRARVVVDIIDRCAHPRGYNQEFYLSRTLASHR